MSLIRIGTSIDYPELGELMFDAIHNGPTKYTPEQSRAWAAEPLKGDGWNARLSAKHVIVAEEENTLLGFMTIEPGGYIDFAYIRPNAQGTGLFRQLFEHAVSWAMARGETELSTHASLMAQPAFAAMGFAVDYHETVEKDGQRLARARMIKQL
ncbi:MAG: GNAT family N-acetyltransferase [Pseudomonadota bacterium]